jgi:methyl-accepting chemotaxis protein
VVSEEHQGHKFSKYQDKLNQYRKYIKKIKGPIEEITQTLEENINEINETKLKSKEHHKDLLSKIKQVVCDYIDNEIEQLDELYDDNYDTIVEKIEEVKEHVSSINKFSKNKKSRISIENVDFEKNPLDNLHPQKVCIIYLQMIFFTKNPR